MDNDYTENTVNIMNAILLQQSIKFYYKDSEKSRICNPHNLYNTTQGNLMLDSYQTGGYSESGKLNQFKMFNISLMRNVTILDTIFDIDKTYNPKSVRYIDSISKVETNGVKPNV